MSVLSDRLTDRVRVQQRLREDQMRLASTLDDVINLSRGDPDLPTAPNIVTAAQHALAERQTRYTYWKGIPELRRAIAEKLRVDNGLTYAPEEIVATGGVEEALYVLFMALVGPGDEVLFADPYYHALPRLTQFAGGTSVMVPTLESDGFILRPEEVERCLTPRSRVLVLVSPHNPTGVILPGDVLEGLADLACRRDLLVISDEIYEKLLFDGAEHRSPAACPGMRERTAVINGFSKTYSMTGFRIGYLAAPGDMVAELEIFKENLSICAPSVSQWAALEALTGPQEVVRQNVRIYDERRRALMHAFDQIGATYVRPQGGVFMFANISCTGLGSAEFCRRLLLEERVLLLSGNTASTKEGYVRASWLLPMAQIDAAADRMAAFVDRVRGEGA